MKVLLSSPMMPFPPYRDGRDRLHHNYGNTTYGQDIFSVPLITHFYGIHLIAQNILTEATVLENPNRRTLIRELTKRYDYVGIYFVIPFFSKVIEMCTLIKRYSPMSKIILGGPGVECFKHATGREQELRSLVDHVCAGEGVRFMRELLNEPVERPIVQDLPMGAYVPFGFRPFASYAPTLIGTLGCTNSCEFCSSSAFYAHRRIPMAEPEEMLQIIRNYIKKYKVSSARLIDENLLIDKDYVRRLGQLMRDDPLCQEYGFSYCTFANLAAIVQYDYEELVENGISGILIGVESQFIDQLDKNIHRKLKGINILEVFRGLTDHGIFIEGSLILGWDFHDKQNIMKEIESYISLHATFDQIVCLQAVPGTKYWERMKREERIAKTICWDDGGFYSRWFQYKNFEPEELWAYEDTALRRAYETWGPSYLRLFEVYLKGYQKFRDHRNPFFRRKAESHRQSCQEIYPLLLPMKLFAPTEKVRQKIDELKRIYLKEIGVALFPKRFLSLVAAMISAYRKFERKIFREDTVQPKTFIYRYPLNAKHQRSF